MESGAQLVAGTTANYEVEAQDPERYCTPRH